MVAIANHESVLPPEQQSTDALATPSTSTTLFAPTTSLYSIPCSSKYGCCSCPAGSRGHSKCGKCGRYDCSITYCAEKKPSTSSEESKIKKDAKESGTKAAEKKTKEDAKEKKAKT